MQATQVDDRFFLITKFTTRTTAQYKVVDDIAREFKVQISNSQFEADLHNENCWFQIFDLEGYQDMSILFPN